MPSRPETLFALSAKISSYAQKHHSKDEIKHALEYLSRIPVEFRNRVFEDLLQIKSIRRQLCNNLSYDDWFQRSGKDWEDYGIYDWSKKTATKK